MSSTTSGATTTLSKVAVTRREKGVYTVDNVFHIECDGDVLRFWCKSDIPELPEYIIAFVWKDVTLLELLDAE
jgi:hypothetical protein